MGIMVIQDMPSLPDDADKSLPNATQQMEFERQLKILVDGHKSFPSVISWVSNPRKHTGCRTPGHPGTRASQAKRSKSVYTTE